MNLLLVRALLDVAYFLNASDDSAIDVDASVEQLERIASTLQGLSVSDRVALRSVIDALATEEEGRGQASVAEFYRGFMESAGMAPR